MLWNLLVHVLIMNNWTVGWVVQNGSVCPLIFAIIKNWIIEEYNSRALIGLAIMVYEPFYRPLQLW